MAFKRVAPMLLAASVCLSGATGLYLGAISPAHAITSVDELTDVNHNSWAFEALRDLVEKYDVIQGYPSHTFRGDRAATRWEMAAALNALIKSVGRDLARLGAEKANKSDLETLARLQEEFKNELNALNARTGALEGRASAIEAKNEEQDNRLSLLEKTQLHGDFTMGGLADLSGDGISAPATSGNARAGNHGILDGLSAVGRLRLSVDVPVRDERDDSMIGKGEVFARLISAFGRVAPNGSQAGSVGDNGPITGYSRIAGDASVFNEGLNTTGVGGVPTLVGGANTRANVYLETAYYKQHFKPGIPLLSNLGLNNKGDNWKATSDFYLGVVPWRFLYDKSPYRGNELDQFQNTAFVNVPGVAVNYNMPMAAWNLHQGLGKFFSADATAGIATLNIGDVYNQMNVNYEARLNYSTGFLFPNWDNAGALYAGGYNAWDSGNTNGITVPTLGLTGATLNRSFTPIPAGKSTVDGMYLGWNQNWYKGIGTTFNYFLSNGGPNARFFTTQQQGTGANSTFNLQGIAVSAHNSYTGVLNIPVGTLIPGFRTKDAIGVGYSMINLYQTGGTTFTTKFHNAFEKDMEAYYRLQLTDSISVVPSVQLIWDRFGLKSNGTSWVIGLRTNYTF